MAKKISSEVTVELSVRVLVNAAWGENCTIAQVHNQAREEAEYIIKKALSNKVRILDGETLNVFTSIK